MKAEKIDPNEKLVRDMLIFIGENPDREGLKDTPKRVLKMWKEVFRGYNKEEQPEITVFNNGKDGVNYNNLIIDTGYYYSHCEHHATPFFGSYFFGYIPNRYIIGASKIARLVDYHSAKLQIAERLADDILNTLQKKLKPKGMILVMNGRHLCKEMRGVKKQNSLFEVSAVRGCFLENKYNCKDEFLMRITNVN